jgi:hypothetical protein
MLAVALFAAQPSAAQGSLPAPKPAHSGDHQVLRQGTGDGLPAYLYSKPRMSQDDIENKKEGTYFTGVPMVMYDTNKGFGLGARGFLIDNGKRASPLFDYTPYRHRTFLQLLATTGGWQMHKLDYDGLYVGDSAYRLRATAFFEKNTAATFFGIGSSSMSALSWSGSGRSYATFKALQADLRTIQPDGTVATDYNLYELLRPGMKFSIEREFFGGKVRALVGASVRHASITTYDGQRVQGDDPVTGRKNVDAIQGPTLLAEQCASGRITGCNGGWDNVLRLAVTLDTRDFELDPNSGVFVALGGQMSSTAFGSSSAYGRLLAELRGFYSPMPRVTDLVLAGHVTYEIQSSNTPFHSMPTLTFADGDVEGLGGLLSVRGYQQNRFVGPVMAFTNVEIRWMPLKFHVAGQHFGIGIVPFFDSGRVYDQVALRFDKWRYGYGGGLRIAWNQATIVAADYGVSSEDRSFGMNFGYSF